MLSHGRQVPARPIAAAEKEDPMTCLRCHGLVMAIPPLVWSSPRVPAMVAGAPARVIRKDIKIEDYYDWSAIWER